MCESCSCYKAERAFDEDDEDGDEEAVLCPDCAREMREKGGYAMFLREKRMRYYASRRRIGCALAK
jgi:hypothetical protein